MKEEKLKMSYEPNTIEHLGVKLYSTLPPIIAELIANSYDADAKEVNIELKDEVEKEIVVSDDGYGMSFEDINEKFLRIGRNRRTDINVRGDKEKTLSGRKIIGKKGLGKLSFFGISGEISIETVRKNKRNSFIMRWDDIMNCEGGKQRDYEPEIIAKDEETDEKDGTTITLKKIKRASGFDAESLAKSISKLFIMDSDFKVNIKHGDEKILVDSKKRYSDLETQFSWQISEDSEDVSDDEKNFLKKHGIKGKIMTTGKPISPRTNLRGIALFSRNKLVNSPEYFSDKTSGHFYSYVTGWLEVDFIDDLEEDVIGTNRQNLIWEDKEMIELRNFLEAMVKRILKEWAEKRGKENNRKLKEKTGIDIQDWYDKMPEDIRKRVKEIVQPILKKSELPDESQSLVIEQLHSLVPEYPYHHWRRLHAKIRETSKEYYKRKDYYSALVESVKLYINEVKKLSGVKDMKEKDLLNKVFSERDPMLSVTSKFKKPDGCEFDEVIKKDINEGYLRLAIAIWTGFRNPISHEEISNLRESNLFTEKHCLDGLSALSHLFDRLDDVEKKE